MSKKGSSSKNSSSSAGSDFGLARQIVNDLNEELIGGIGSSGSDSHEKTGSSKKKSK